MKTIIGLALFLSVGAGWAAKREFTYSVRVGGAGPRELLEVTGGGIAVDGAGQPHVLLQPGTVLKMNTAGTAPLYRVALAGVLELNAIALDGQGNAYVTGLAAVGNAFPVTTRLPGVAATGPVGGHFVTKLDAAGRIVYALVLSTTPDQSGTNQKEGGNAVAVDARGAAIVGGATIGDIVTTAEAYQAARPVEQPCRTYRSLCTKGYVVKVNPAGTGLEWGTYLGGNQRDGVKGLGVDATGAVYAGGFTNSANFPVTAEAPRGQLTSRHEFGEAFPDGFALKLSADGRRLEYSTLIGGEYPDGVNGVAVDGAGRAHLVGYTSSPDFPLKDEMQNEPFCCSGSTWPNEKAFLTILDARGGMAFSTFFGASGRTEAATIALGSDGSVYLGGSTRYSDFPTVEAPQPSFRAGNCWLTPRFPDACRGGYFARIRPDLRRLIFSTFVGGYGPGDQWGVTQNGNQFDAVRGVAVGRDGAVYASGYTREGFPVVGNYQPGGGETFVTRMEGLGEVRVDVAAPEFSRESVVMAPSGVPSVMRGSWISIYGRNFLRGTGSVVADRLPLPVELGGVSVNFNGHAGRIHSVTSLGDWEQINVQVPWDIDGRTYAAVVVSSSGVASYITFAINRFRIPEVFRTNFGNALVLHAADFSLVSQEHPATPGETLVLYATGLGPVKPPVADGAAAPLEPLCLPTIPDNVVTINGRLVTPLFAGLAPGMVGIFQVNFQLPAETPPGQVEIGMRFGTPAKMWVR